MNELAHWIKTTFLIVQFCALFTSVECQLPPIIQADPVIYLQQLKQVRVVKNNGIVPLVDLHQENISLVLMDTSDFPEFVHTMKQYANVSLADDLVDTEPSILVFALHAQDVASLMALEIDMPTIVVIFGEEDQSDFTDFGFEVVITAPNHDVGHSLAAQAIFGGVHMTDAKPIRLGYAPPGSQGMDAMHLSEQISSIIEEGLDSMAFPGAQVLVARNGKIVYHETFGYHTYEHHRPVARDDIYDFASVTKTTSALLAVMKLHGDGNFDLDAPLARYFPSFKNSNKKALTFREMLAHNARLRPWIPYWQGSIKGNAKYPWKKRWNAKTINTGRFRKETMSSDSSADFSIKLHDNLWLHKDFKKDFIYKSIRKSPLNKEPGYVYSGLLFYLLPDIVERITSQDYEEYLWRNFYEPIGATSLGYKPASRFDLDRIVPTERDTFFRLMQIHGVVHDEGAAMMEGVSANAGLFGSAPDLARLAQMLLNGGSYGGKQLIKRSAVLEFTRCQFCDEGNRRGLGFDKPLIEYNQESSSVAKDASPASYGHSGYTGTFYWIDPSENLVYIFFSNRVFPTRNNRKLYTLGIRPRIHQAIYDSIKAMQQ